MKSEQSDVVLRVIEQLAGVLRHLVEQLGLGAPAAAEVVREAKAAQGELLGPLSAGLANVDAASAVALLREQRRVRLWIEFLLVEAAGLRLQGDEAGAVALEARALALRAAVDEAYPEPGPSVS